MYRRVLHEQLSFGSSDYLDGDTRALLRGVSIVENLVLELADPRCLAASGERTRVPNDHKACQEEQIL